MSYHDFGGAPEKVYHALVLGMLVWLSGKYEIRSNRESGYGRYDIMLKPSDKTKPGIVIEFKLVDGREDDAHEQVLEDALKQITERKYAEELTAAGIADILEIAVAFRGKELWMRHRAGSGAWAPGYGVPAPERGDEARGRDEARGQTPISFHALESARHVINIFLKPHRSRSFGTKQKTFSPEQ